MKKLTTALVLTTLLLTPALPARADGGPAAGLFGWLQGWLDGAMSRVTGEEGPKIDPYGLTDEQSSDNGDVGPQIDPAGLTDDQSSDDGDVGGQMDPAG